MAPDPTRLGRYDVIGRLGAGGMGEVYRARDTRLERDVAIKILPAGFADDPDRIARFQQEARTIAALSHPNVIAVFDTGVSEEPGAAGGRLYVVTELLEGETLGERLASGPLAPREAVDIAAEIARGLAAAHDKGIVHRDLKPGNVFLTTAGHIKILDFGLARAAPPNERPGSLETRAVTGAGAVLGTVGYMAPEQVRGQPVDARADLFALGVVLHEMLSGQRPFRRDTPAETMTAILREDPPQLLAARPDMAPALDRIVRHCLEKSPDDRFQTARDVAFALESLSGSDVSPVAGAAGAIPTRSRPGRERLIWATVAAVLSAALVWLRVTPPAPAPAFTALHRSTLLLPAGVTLPQDIQPGARFAISPDGTRLAFVGTGAGRGAMLWLQSLSESSPRLVEGSEGASTPFWSTDGRIIVFRQANQMMKLDVAETGRPVSIGPMHGASAWGRGPSGEDLIVTPIDSGPSTVLRGVSPGGGAPVDLSTPQAGKREFYAYPSLLPGGRHALFGYGREGDPSSYGFYVTDVRSRVMTRLTSATATFDYSNGAYASGYLVTARAQTITARSFDLERLIVDTAARDVAGPIEALPAGTAAFSVSQNGVLVFQPALAQTRTRLTLVDRSGAQVRTLADEGEYSNLELSPDGSRLALSLPDPTTGTRDIWVVDVARGVRSRVTFDPSQERSAVWFRDGKSLVYTSRGLDLYTRALGAGAETPFIKDGASKDPRQWSPDGRFLLYRVTGPGTRNDLWIKPRDDRPARPFIATPFDENYGVFSPDGRWMAYASDESGRFEVYATSFPSGEGKWQISTTGGSFPRWRADNREIVYLSTDGRITSVPVDATGHALSVSRATALFESGVLPIAGSPFDMSADGKLFFVNRAIASSGPPSLIVVYNWPRLLGPR